MGGWFSGFTSLTDISTLNKIDTSNCTSLNNTFYNCKAITSFEIIRNWDVSKVTDMPNTFSNCSAIESIEFLSDWDVSIVYGVGGLFQGCSLLKSIDPIYGWNISDNINNCSGLFQDCSSLTSVDLTRLNWNWTNIQDVSYLFYNCAALQSVNVSNIVTANTKNLTNAFGYCSALTSIEGLGTWDTSGATQMYAMFNGASAITSLDISGLEVTSTTNIGYMFGSNTALKQLSISNSLASRIKDTGLFTLSSTWYDIEGNEYTQDNPMTTGGTYYTEKQECEHDWQLTSTDPAGCTTTGTEHYTCSICSETKTETIEATGHSYGAWVDKTAATCLGDKVQERTCSGCGNKQTQTVANTKLGHLYGDPDWEWSANHSSATAKFTCTRSGCTNTRNLSATVTQSTQNATCLAAGKTTYTAT
ncbi:MAG: DUF285 domain-containing protein, partial [Clostridia bacterium]|nr:DUF285 domain-containing protein [Clostridia bacterium]